MEEKVQNAMIKYSKLFIGNSEELSFEGLGNGEIFSRMLLHAQGFRFVFGEFQENPSNWVHKLSNLKLIAKKVSQYFEYKLGKGIKTNDINFIEIAKNNKKTEILKLFEVVLATLTQAPNKQEHINKIMSLDEATQSDFVWLIQKIIQGRIIQLEVYKQQKQLYVIQQLQFENTLLQRQIDSIFEHKSMLEEELAALKLKIEQKEAEIEETMEKIGVDSSDENYMLSVHNEQLKNMIENLKNKLLETNRKHEHEVCRFQEQINLLNHRIRKLESVEEALDIYKEKYDQIRGFEKDTKKLEKQKVKLGRQLAQKQSFVKKIQEKLDEAIEQNYQHEEKQVYLMMEMEKKEIQFRELEKEVKRKIATMDTSQNFSISDNNTNLNNLSQDLSLPHSLTVDQLLQAQQLKQSVNKLKKKCRQTERENQRLKKKLQKIQKLQWQQKKLQKMVIAAHEGRTEQLHLIVSIVDDLFQRNCQTTQSSQAQTQQK